MTCGDIYKSQEVWGCDCMVQCTIQRHRQVHFLPRLKKTKQTRLNVFDLLCSQQGSSRLRAVQARAREATSATLTQKDREKEITLDSSKWRACNTLVIKIMLWGHYHMGSLPVTAKPTASKHTLYLWPRARTECWTRSKRPEELFQVQVFSINTLKNELIKQNINILSIFMLTFSNITDSETLVCGGWDSQIHWMFTATESRGASSHVLRILFHFIYNGNLYANISLEKSCNTSQITSVIL